MMQSFLSRYGKLFICLLIAATTAIAYLPVRDNGFVNYDDEEYVVKNGNVQGGLTLEGLQWAFTTLDVGNWHPLTWLSHMMDCSLFGLNPAGHHLTSLFLHILNALLLFLVLNRMTHALWRSAFVAALFALHPLHVESVAWIAERKDVLSGLFWILSMGAYVLYAERPGIRRYSLVFAMLAFALMAKPMAVTLPFVFLLLDYWPLGRFRTPRPSEAGDEKPEGPESVPVRKKKTRQIKAERTPSEKRASPQRDPGAPGAIFRRLVSEKIPLFLLSLLSSAATYIAQQKGGAVALLEAYPLADRLQNAAVSYIRYLLKVFYPADLSVFYPYVAHPFWQIAGSVLLLLLAVFLVVRLARRLPYLPVGWFWYLGTLFPVIGIVKVGLQSMADRYTYLPSIGLFVLIVWGLHDLTRNVRKRALVLGAFAAAVLVLLSAATWRQARLWKDDPTLYGHALEAAADNHVAHFGLGLYYDRQGDPGKAVDHYAQAIRILPTQPDYLNNMGNSLAKLGRTEEAAARYREAIALQDDNALSHFNYAWLLAVQGKYDEAERHFRKALDLNPEDSVACIMLADMLSRQGKLDEALHYYARSLQIDPNRADVHFAMGKILAFQGKKGEAAENFRKALRLDPDHGRARQALERVLP